MLVQGPVAVWLYPVLALIGVVNAAIGGWYYLRIITVMYLRVAVKPIETPGNFPGFATLMCCVLLTLFLSVPPGANWLLGAARQTTLRPQPVQAAANNPPAP
jgi:NADH-quinone oxidoreductase subunit N